MNDWVQVIVASGLIAYLGAFTPDFRESAVKHRGPRSNGRDRLVWSRYTAISTSHSLYHLLFITRTSIRVR